MTARVILLAVLGWLLGAPAYAAPKDVSHTLGAETSASVSYANWAIEGARVRLRFMVPTRETYVLAKPGEPAPRRAHVGDTVLLGLTVKSSGGDCYAIDQGEGVGEIYALAATPGIFRYEIIYDCPVAQGITLRDSFLFKENPRHVTYASVRHGKVAPVLVRFDRATQNLTLPDEGAVIPGPSVTAYGIEAGKGLFLRLDTLAALLGLLLLAARWSDLKRVAAGLAAGYGAAFALTWTGLVLTHPPLAGAAAGLLVVILAVSALRRQTAQADPPPSAWRAAGAVVIGLLAIGAAVAAARLGALSGIAMAGVALFGLALVWTAGGRNPPWLLALPAAAFGLLDGMALVSDLSPLQLPMARIWPAILGYDLGALITAAALVTLAMALGWLAGRKLGFLRKGLVDLTGAGLIGMGVFWFVTRLYS